MYELLKYKPIAKFYYRGHHSHPVRRTVFLISTDKDSLTGYELRAGETVNELESAPVKTYLKENIPKWGDYWRLRRYNKDYEASTLNRCSVANLQKTGV